MNTRFSFFLHLGGILRTARMKCLPLLTLVGLADSLAAFKENMASGQKLQELMSTGNHPNRKGHDLVRNELMKWFPQEDR